MQEKIAERAKLWYKKDNKSGKEVFPMPEMLDIVDENGVPTGMLHERARHLVYDILTKYTKEQLKQFILDYQNGEH